jgi:diadenosine tetraphosphatase ApaH/serine/threonine PP2A family protein phosphatase
MEGGSSVSFASEMAAFDQLAAGSVVALPDDCYQGVVGLANAGQNRGRWTNAVLTKENTQWLAKLRRGPVWPIRRKVQCVHGPPKDEDEYTFFREDAWAAMNTSRARIVFCGHTHWQTGWSFHGRELTPLKPEYQSSDGAEQFEVPLHKGYRYLFNPGSVGQPRGGDCARHSRSMTKAGHYSPGIARPTKCI